MIKLFKIIITNNSNEYIKIIQVEINVAHETLNYD